MTWLFGEYELDDVAHELRRGGKPVSMQRKAFDLLRYLVEYNERLVAKEELIEQVWPEAAVSDASLTQAIKQARSALNDRATPPRLIKTVRGRGYRFCGTVTRGPRPTLRGHVFVGRAAEMNHLRGAFGRASEGAGSLVLVTGEPGIGKTRLLQEIGNDAASSGASVLWGRCWEHGGAPAFWPWGETIRSALAVCDRSTLDALGVALTDLERFLDVDSAAPLGLDKSEGRYRLFQAVRSLVRQMATVRPLLLLLDDVHAAEESSLLLLSFLIRELGTTRALVVATYREEESHRQSAAMQTLTGLAQANQPLRLVGLSRIDVTSVMEKVLERRPPEDLVEHVYDKTAGNPLFVDEVTRLLASGERAALPAMHDVREAIHRRLAPLGKITIALLRTAAVLGRHFDVKLLARTAELPPEDVIEQIEVVVRDGIVEPWGAEGSYRFRHTLLGETLYGDLSEADRAEMHLRVADALGEGAARNDSLALRAHHYMRAIPRCRVYAQAVRAAVAAAEAAVRQCAYEDAIALYRSALVALEGTDSTRNPERFDLTMSLGQAQHLAGANADAMATLEKAAHWARAAGDPDRLARAALGYGEASRETGVANYANVALLEDALRGLTGESLLRAQLLARLSAALTFSTSTERRLECSSQAVEMARRLGDSTTLSLALYGRWFALWGVARAEDRLVLSDEMLALTLSSNHVELLLDATAMRATGLLEKGDSAGAYLAMERLRQIASSARSRFYLWWSALHTAARAMLEGRLEEAEGLIMAAYAAGDGVQDGARAFFLGVQIMALRRDQERIGELLPSMQANLDQEPTRQGWRSSLALGYALMGNEAMCAAAFERMAVDEFKGIPHDPAWLPIIGQLAEACTFLGDRRRAETLYGLLRPWSGLAVIVGTGAAMYGHTSLFLGLLARTLGRPAESARHFETALEVCIEMGAVCWAKRSAEAYLDLLAEGAIDLSPEARRLIATAEDRARAVGLPVRSPRA